MVSFPQTACAFSFGLNEKAIRRSLLTHYKYSLLLLILIVP